MKTKTGWLWISCAGAPLAVFAQAVTLSPTKLDLALKRTADEISARIGYRPVAA